LARVPLPQPCTKSMYQWIMGTYRLSNKWEDKHTRAFLDLKIAITLEPILRGPCWDGTPFIVMTDGCQDGFAGVLAQQFPHTKPDRSQTQKIHPMAFASKQTSPSKAKYKPFLLEFAALKFALDKFSDIIWGFPIEIKTDCQALHDTLLSRKPSTVHACWRNRILAHQIVDIRHMPGKINVVADRLSQQWEGHTPLESDRSNWTVNPDTDETIGLTNDILATLEAGSHKQVTALKNRLQNEHLFIEVINAIMVQDSTGTVRQ
jgi:RNase H-like domain found in reverse transcriptase